MKKPFNFIYTILQKMYVNQVLMLKPSDNLTENGEILKRYFFPPKFCS